MYPTPPVILALQQPTVPKGQPLSNLALAAPSLSLLQAPPSALSNIARHKRGRNPDSHGRRTRRCPALRSAQTTTRTRTRTRTRRSRKFSTCAAHPVLEHLLLCCPRSFSLCSKLLSGFVLSCFVIFCRSRVVLKSAAKPRLAHAH
jgi:hypothetical protein